MKFRCVCRYEFETPDGEDLHIETTGTSDGNTTRVILPNRSKECALKWKIKKVGSHIQLADRCTLVYNNKETDLQLTDGKLMNPETAKIPDKDFWELLNKLTQVTQDAQYSTPYLNRCLDRMSDLALDAADFGDDGFSDWVGCVSDFTGAGAGAGGVIGGIAGSGGGPAGSLAGAGVGAAIGGGAGFSFGVGYCSAKAIHEMQTHDGRDTGSPAFDVSGNEVDLLIKDMRASYGSTS